MMSLAVIAAQGVWCKFWSSWYSVYYFQNAWISFCNWATPCPLFRVEIPLKVIPWSKTNIIFTWQFDFHNLIVTSRSDFFPPSAKLLNFRKMFSNESCCGTALCEFFCHIYWKIIMWNSCFDFGKKWYLWNINCCLRLQLL